MKLGIFYTCYNEERAVKNSITELRKHYPDSPIFLVSDGGSDFSYLLEMTQNISVSHERDTMSSTFNVTSENFREPIHQKNILDCAIAVLDRLERCIEYCKSDYILMMDPDTLVRGKLNIDNNSVLLGSRINKGLPYGVKNILSQVEGAKVIDCWGATPGIFKVETFTKSMDFIKSNKQILKDLCGEFYAIYAHDVLLPLLFALIGEEETFNPDIIECLRVPNWEDLQNPLVHQYRKYY